MAAGGSGAALTPVEEGWRWMIALVGPPGSGKGTQAAWLTRALGLTAFSTGDLARTAAREPTEHGRVVQRYLGAGALLPDRLVFELVGDAIASVPASARGLLLDGFPRTETQARFLEAVLLPRPLDVYVELRVDEEVLLERLASRGRDDDHDLAVLRRLDEFDRSTRALIDRIQAEGRLVTVDGAQPPAMVHRAITDALGQRRQGRVGPVEHGLEPIA